MSRAGAQRKGWEPLERCPVGSGINYAALGLSEPDAVYGNRLYSVFVREIGHGALHISFHRRDRAAVRDWRHLQAIKNEVAGPERTAIEVFPPEAKLVDSANEYHLWVLPPEIDLPFALDDGAPFLMTQEQIVEEFGPDTKARQRPWEPGIPTGLGVER